MMKALADCQLYTFIDTAYFRGRHPEEIARQLCDGGSDLIQLRAKGVPRAEVRHMADAIQPIVSQAGVWLVINDHPEIAQEVGATLCHLGQEDFFDAGHHHVSDLLPADSPVRIGLSSHSPHQAACAIAAGAAYVAVGPVFATPTKPGTPAVTLEYVRWAAESVRIPWFAIGGIHLGNLEAVLEAGARRICVVSAVLEAPDVARACQEFRKRLSSAPPSVSVISAPIDGP
jgi:thiamine-phosphate pyrophosphorylase